VTTDGGASTGDRSGVRVRPFRPDDAAAVARALVDSSIHHAALEPARYEIQDEEAIADTYRLGRQHDQTAPPDEHATFVAEIDGGVVGVLDIHVARPGSAHRRLRYGWIDEVAVAATARGRGAGSALIAEAEAWARARGCTYSGLDHNAYNEAAGRLYRERLGYEPAGVILVKPLMDDDPVPLPDDPSAR
jgi:GNAT superfamily N-acetyltransferase